MSNETASLNESLQSMQTRTLRDHIETPMVVEVDGSISKIIGVMTDKNVYDVFVPLSHNNIASVNIRDLLDARDITSTRPSILGKTVPLLSLDDTVGHAARIMSYYRVRALPIGNKSQQIVGQISAKGLVKSIHNDLNGKSGNVIGSNIMTPNPIVVTESDKVSAARSIMKRRRIDHLPVTNKKGELSGMVTSSQILSLMLQSEKIGRRALGIEKLNRLDMSISGIADRTVVTSKPDDSVHSITGIMLDTASTYSILTSAGQINGIVTYGDIVALLAEKIAEDLPAFIIGLPDDPSDAEHVRSKFASIVRYLKNMEPGIEEARCKIKLRNLQGKRRRYEIDVRIITPYKSHTYADSGWDLSKLFDEMSDSLKKKFAHKKTQRGIESSRKRLQEE
jgi:CBS domain-containing protein